MVIDYNNHPWHQPPLYLNHPSMVHTPRFVYGVVKPGDKSNTDRDQMCI